MKYNPTEEEFRKLVLESKSLQQCIINAGLVPAGGSFNTFKRRIIKYDINTDHFLGQGWRKGSSVPVVPPKDLKEILLDGPYTSSYKLKNRLIKEGILINQCDRCKLTEWCGEPMPTELHHINGAHRDNRIENLQILCNNCHALTDNFRGKNKKIFPAKQIHYCTLCNIELSEKRKTKLCNACYMKNRSPSKNKNTWYKINWPTNEELLALIDKSNKTQVAKSLGVSRAAINQRLKRKQ